MQATWFGCFLNAPCGGQKVRFCLLPTSTWAKPPPTERSASLCPAAPPPRTCTSVLSQLAIWRQHHANVECTLVRGNHDSRAGDPPPSLAISVVDEPYLVGPFAACHYPQAHASHAVLAGHTHPVVRLQGPARDRLSLPCFVFEDRSAILPAFGEFTGGYTVTPQPGLLLFAAGGQSVWRLPSARGLIASSKDMAQR